MQLPRDDCAAGPDFAGTNDACTLSMQDFRALYSSMVRALLVFGTPTFVQQNPRAERASGSFPR